MSSTTKHTLCVLWEHEIRAAAKALRLAQEASGKPPEEITDEERARLMYEALDAAIAALWHVEDAASVVLSSVPKVDK